MALVRPETRYVEADGMTVHQAARVQGVARNSEVLESGGTQTLKGVPGPCRLYRVVEIAQTDTWAEKSE